MFEKMRDLRKAKGLSAKQLGEMVGVAEVTISTYETGKRLPPVDIVCAIADIFDVSLDYLVRGKEKGRPFGRSLEENLKLFRELSDEQIDYFTQLMQAVKADRRFQAHLRQDASEVQ